MFSKISDYADATKRTSKRVDKLTSEFLQVKRQSLTMGSQLEHICQHLGAKVRDNNAIGGFSVGFFGPRPNGPYVPPNMRGAKNSTNVALETPQQGEG